MEENIVVNVEIDRNGVTTTSVQVVPLDIPWEDFELMVRNIWRKLFGKVEDIYPTAVYARSVSLLAYPTVVYARSI